MYTMLYWTTLKHDLTVWENIQLNLSKVDPIQLPDFNMVTSVLADILARNLGPRQDELKLNLKN